MGLPAAEESPILEVGEDKAARVDGTPTVEFAGELLLTVAEETVRQTSQFI